MQQEETPATNQTAQRIMMPMTRFRPVVPRRGYAATAAIFLALSGCYEEKDETIPQPAQDSAAVAPADAAPDWLEVEDPRTPEAFLAGASGLPAAQLAPSLATLTAHYRESPRMIANRVLQLWREYPDVSLDRMMADLVPPADAPQQSLGPVAQQYRVLRDRGADHAEALAGARGGAGR